MKLILFTSAFVALSCSVFAKTATTFVEPSADNETIREYAINEHSVNHVSDDDIVSGHIDIRWGDLGNGTFANPVINSDYSDPDVIRVGNKYYMTCSEFHFMGMPILQSDDMVNWKIIGQVFDSIDYLGYSSMEKFGSGSWAPSLRYHDGKFWIYVCTPDEGLFMSWATSPEGPWSKLLCVKNVKGWEDPCPLWDNDGQAYLGRSQLGGGPIYIHKMSSDGTTLLDDGVKVYEGPVAEGTKLFKRNGYYYMSIPEGGVSTGWQTVLRSKSIYGPYDGRRVLEMGSTQINGPHQGALVDTPDGQWWFFHFQSTEPQGRVVHLQPVKWVDGFPFIGKDYDNNGIGEPMKICPKPETGAENQPSAPQSSDDFNSSTLALQWQFNHNPNDEKWSLASRSGWLEITSQKAQYLKLATNQLTQKTMGYHGMATVEIDYSAMVDGQKAGLSSIGSNYYGAGISIIDNNPVIYFESKEGETTIIKRLKGIANGSVLIRLVIDGVNNNHQYYFSIDGGQTFLTCGDAFQERSTDWKGSRVGLYTYHTGGLEGKAYFDNFEYVFDGPGGLSIKQ